MKFKSKVYLISKDFKSIDYVDFAFEVNINENDTFNDKIEFKCTLPDYIFNELADTEPRFKTTFDINNKPYTNSSKKSLTSKFKKTQYSSSLEILKEYISDLSHIIFDRHDANKDEFIKKLFVSFKSNDVTYSNGYNYAYLGEKISTQFNFFVGYEVIYKKPNNNLTNRPKYIVTKAYHPETSASINFENRGIVDNITTDPFKGTAYIQSYSILDWTEEREEFLKKLYDKFRRLNNELSTYLSDLNDNNIDFLINGNNNLLN